jgi:Molybdopterin-binding domain of aldehyde dehydrogenase
MADCCMGSVRMRSKAGVRLKGDGTAVVEAGFHDISSGTLTVMPQVAADVLGLPIERVSSVMGDTTLPQAGPTYRSSSTLSGGSAVHRAAVDVRGKLARLANLPPDRAVMRDGRVGLEAAGSGQAIEDVMRQAGVGEISGDGEWEPAPALTRPTRPRNPENVRSGLTAKTVAPARGGGRSARLPLPLREGAGGGGGSTKPIAGAAPSRSLGREDRHKRRARSLPASRAQRRATPRGQRHRALPLRGRVPRLHPHQPVFEGVLPDRETWAGGAPGVHRLRIGSRTGRDPGEEL